MTTAVLSFDAQRDVVDAVTWIAQDNPSAAKSFRDAVEEAAIRLGQFPLSGTERLDVLSAPRRFMVLKGFPYVLVYNAETRPPVILRVLHTARDLPEALREG